MQFCRFCGIPNLRIDCDDAWRPEIEYPNSILIENPVIFQNVVREDYVFRKVVAEFLRTWVHKVSEAKQK